MRTYTFKHALVQDAAYSTLLRGRRQQLHGQIAARWNASFQRLQRLSPSLWRSIVPGRPC